MALNFFNLFQSLVPMVRPGDPRAARLAELPSRLGEAGFTEEGVRPVFSGQDLCQRFYRKVPSYLRACRELEAPLSWLIPLLLLREPVEAKPALTFLGEDLSALLTDCGVLHRTGDTLCCLYDLQPCHGAYIFTDGKFLTHETPGTVYVLGRDSYNLTRVVPRAAVGTALDLCTGSGVHAVLSARHAGTSEGVDVNPRALAVAQLNALVNGVECRWHRGDLYAPVEGRRYGLVTANPPFIPTPEESMELYRTGGESGEEVTARIFTGLTDHLEEGGTLALVTTYPVLKDSHALDRVERWLGGAAGWGLGLMNFGFITREDFIDQQFRPQGDRDADREEIQRWVDSYDRLGIERIVFGVFFVRRLPAGAPGWRSEITVDSPDGPVNEETGEWLARLAAPATAERWRLSPRVRALWREELSGRGRVEFTNPWWPAADLDAGEMTLVEALRNEPGPVPAPAVGNLAARLIITEA